MAYYRVCNLQINIIIDAVIDFRQNWFIIVTILALFE